MIKEKLGDLIEEAFNYDIIVHGCNCHCIMGAGIAVGIRRTFPEAYEADCSTFPGDRTKLGTYTYANIERAGKRPLIVLNAYTQYHSNPKLKPFDYYAFKLCLQKMTIEFNRKRFAFPMIGAGLAGGEWNTIREMIQQYMKGQDVTIIYYEPELFAKYVKQ